MLILRNISIKWGILNIFLLLIISVSGITQSNNHEISWKIKWEELPSLPPGLNQKTQAGLAGAFAGSTENVVIVAGGTNFPGKMVWDGGKKSYHDDIFILEKNGRETYKWELGHKFPYKVAYGLSITTELGIVCIGGNNSDEHFSSVILMKWNKELREVEFEKLPDMPYTCSQMSGSVLNNKIYVAGGYIDGVPGNKFVVLDLDNYGKPGWSWEYLPDYPGPPRLQAVVVAQNAGDFDNLYMISGSSYSTENENPDILCSVCSYHLINNSWTYVSDIKPDGNESVSLHGASGIKSGVNHILFIGGVNKEIFYNAWKRERTLVEAKQISDYAQIQNIEKEIYNYFTQEPEYFRFNKQILIYHTITENWISAGEYPYPAPAGATMIDFEDGFLMINGEIKPGVRSKKVYYGKIVYKPNFGLINYLVLLIYLIGMLYLGYFFMKREKSTNDFFKGGGRIPWWAAGISIFATMLSAITFMAIPAKTYMADWRYFTMAVTICMVVPIIVKFYLPFFRKLKVTSAYEYLEIRFNLSSRLLASVLFSVFMVSRIAIVLFLPSLALSTVTGISVYACIIAMGIVTIVYCTMGGIEAVIWGDVIQGFILLGGAIISVIFLVSGTEGGFSGIIDLSAEQEKFKILDFAFNLKQPVFWVVLFGGLANNLISYSSDQTVIQRYLTTKNEKSAAKGIWLNGIISIPVSVLFYFLGTVLYSFYKSNPQDLYPGMENADSIFPYFIVSHLPVGIAGLLIAAIFSATMSTLSSNINSVATAFTTDFYKRLFPESSDSRRLFIARISGIIVGIAGILLALFMVRWNIKSIFDHFNIIIGLFASGLGGLFAMGLFTKRINSVGALSGFIGSAIALIIVKYFTDISFLLYGFIGLVICFIIGYMVSMIIPSGRKDLKGLTIYDNME